MTWLENCRQIHHAVARLKKATKELQQEFNRTDLKILEYDDYINQYIDDKHVAYDEQLYPYGFQNIGNTSVTGGKPLPTQEKLCRLFGRAVGRLNKYDWAGNNCCTF